MTESIFIVFTRNWIDPDGVEKGFRWTKAAGSRRAAENSAKDANENPVSSKSKWEVSEISEVVLIQNLISKES